MIIIGESALELKSGKYIFEEFKKDLLKKIILFLKIGMHSIFYHKMHLQLD